MNSYVAPNQILPEFNIDPKAAIMRSLPKGAGLRRCIRFILLLAIVAAITAAVFIFAVLSYTSKIVEYDISNKIEIKESNCKLYFVEDNTLLATKFKVKAEVPGLKSATVPVASGGTIKISAQNSGNFTDACWVRITSAPDAIFSGGISFACTGNCVIVHEGPRILNLGTSDFIISGQKTSANFQGISANKIEFTSTKGDLYIHSANLSADSFMKTDEGDVVFQSMLPYKVQVVSYSKYYCIGSPAYDSIVADTCATPTSSPCGITATLCTVMPCPLAGIPFVALTGNFGNVFANFISHDDTPVDESTIPKYTGDALFDTDEVKYNTNTYAFDSRTQSEYAKAFKKYNMTSKTDSLLMFNIGNYDARASSLIKFMATPNPAYLSAKPWWMSFFSLTLLIGSAINLPTRLVPGYCPYRPFPDLGDLYFTQMFLSNKLYQPNRARDDIGMLYAPELKTILSTHTKSYGSEEMTLDYDVYELVKDKTGNILFSAKSMYKVNTLAAAVFISVALAGFIGIVGMISFIFALKFFFTYLGSESDHIIKYVKEDVRSNGTKYLTKAELVAFQEEGKITEVKANKEADAFSDVRSESSHLLSSRSSHDQENASSASANDKKKDYGKINKNLGQKISVFRILKALPNQFEVLDHIVFFIKRYLLNSAEEFLSYLLVPLKNEEYTDVQYNMNEIKSLYEKYCFLKSYPEVDITGALAIKAVTKKGFKFEKREDATTEVFKKIKLLDKPNDTDLNKEENETSLAYFIRTMCKQTSFDEDCIECELFKKRYSEFCMEKREQEVLITRTTMTEMHQIEAEKMENTFLERNPDYLTEPETKTIKGASASISKKDIKTQKIIKKLFKVDTEGMKKKITEALALHSKSEKFYEANKGTPLGYAWFLIDLLGVVFHFLFIILFTLIFVGIPYFFELMSGQYSLSDYHDVIKMQDFVYAQWNIFFKLKYMQIASIVLFCIGAFYAAISILDLFVYYIKMKFPMATIRIFSKMYDVDKIKSKLTCGSCLRGFINGIEWVYIFLAMGLLLFYVFLVLEWNILGAILNPTAYLVYASSASTFLVFLTAKYNSFKELHKLGLDGLKELLMKEVAKGMNAVMNKILQKQGISTDKDSKKIDQLKTESTSLEDTLLTILANTPIGKKAAAAGFDIPIIVKILENDAAAITQFASKHGFPPGVLKAGISLIHVDFPKVEAAIIELASSPPFKLPPELIKCIMNLIFKHSELNIPKIISEIAIVFIDFIQDKLHSKSPHFDMVKVAFPQAMNAIIALKNRDMDGFLDELGKMGTTLYEGVFKKFIFEKSIQSEHSDKLQKMFSPDGDSTFSISDIFLNVIELAKVLISGSKTGIAINLQRLRPAILKIIGTLTKIDKDLLEFISLVFSASAEKLMLGDKSTKFVLKADLRPIAKKVAKLIKVPEYFVKIFFKFLFGDRTIDDDLINELLSIITTRFPSLKFLNAALIRNIIRLYTLFKSRNPRKYLLSQASKFKVDPKDAEALIMLSTGAEFMSEGVSSIMDTKLLDLFANSLKISKKEVNGFLSLIMGNFESPDVNLLLRSVCIRNNLPLECELFMLAILKIVVSNNTDEILHSLHTLKIEEQVWILIGKKLIQPRYIDAREFARIGIASTNEIASLSHKIVVEDKISFALWKSKLENELNNPNPSSDSLNAYTNYLMQVSQNKGIIGIDSSAPLNDKAPVDTTVARSLAVKRQLIYKLLKIESIQVTTQLIKQFLDNYNSELKRSSKDPEHAYQLNISPDQLAIIANFLSIKYIIKRESPSSINNAAKSFCLIMKLNEDMILNLITIVTSSNSTEIKAALKVIFNEVTVGGEDSNNSRMSDYGKFVAEELSAIKEAQKAVPYISEHLRVPEFLIKKFLMPYDHSSRLKINDVLMLLDFLHINDQNPNIPKELEIPKFGSSETTKIGLNEFKLLIASIAVGHASNLDLALDLFGIPINLKSIVQAFLSPNIPTMISVLQEKLGWLISKLGVPPALLDFILAIFSFFNGNALETKFRTANIFEYFTKIKGTDQADIFAMFNSGNQTEIFAMDVLSKMLRIRIEIFEILDILIFKRGKVLLINPICALLQNNIKMPAYVLKGFASVLTGKALALEDFAEALGMKDDRILDIFIMFSDFANPKYIASNLENLRRKHSFSYFCYELNITPEILIYILKMSFNVINYKDITDIINALKLGDDIDIEFLRALMSIARGYNSIEEFERENTSADSTLRLAITNEIKQHCSPFFIKSGLDPDFAMIALRIRQGDFKIIDDKENYLHPMLPSQSIRNVTMGVVGLLTHPVSFEARLGSYPKELPISLSFEGANHLLCTTLNINPIVLRLIAFEKDTYDYLWKNKLTHLDNGKVKVTKQALAALLMSLGNPAFSGVTALIGRSFMRYLKIMQDNLKALKAKMERGDKPKFPHEGAEEEEEEKKEEAKKDELKPPPVPDKAPSEKPELPEVKKDEEKKEGEVKKEEGKKEEVKVEEKKDEVKKEEAKKEEKKDEINKDLPKIIEEGYTKFSNYFDNVDYLTHSHYSNVESLYELLKNGGYIYDSASVIEEKIELFFFNNPNWMLFNYDALLDDKKKRHFNFSKKRLEEILGQKNAFDKSIASSFYVNGTEIPDIWENVQGVKSLKLSLDTCWLNKDFRPKSVNIWSAFKEILLAIDKDPKITNGKELKYDRISVLQMMLYIFILSAKYRIESKDWETTDSNYVILMSEIDNILYSLELLGFATGSLDMGFDRIRVMKFISLATGIKISNRLDFCFMESLYCKQRYYNFKDAFKNYDTVNSSLKELEGMEYKYSGILEAQGNNFSTFTRDFTSSENFSTENSYYNSSSPYNLDKVQSWSYEKFPYKETSSKLKMDEFGEGSIKDKLRKDFMIKPKSIRSDIVEPEKSEEKDPVSGLPYKIVWGVLIQFEQYICADDGLTLILELAKCNVEILDSFSKSLKSLDIIKGKDSITIYKALYRLMCMLKLSSDFRDLKKLGTASGLLNNDVIKDFFSLMGANVKFDAQIAESIIMVSHGNFDLPYLIDIGAKFGIKSELLEAILVLRKGSTEEIFKKLDAIIEALDVHKVPYEMKTLHIILQIYRGNFEGVEKLINLLPCQDIYRNILKCLIKLLNKSLLKLSKKDVVQKLKFTSILNLDLSSISTIVPQQDSDEAAVNTNDNINELMKCLNDMASIIISEIPELKKICTRITDTLQTVTKLLIGIIKKDINVIIPSLSLISREFSFPEEIVKVLEAFIVMINNDSTLSLGDKISNAIDVVANAVSKILKNKSKEIEDLMNKFKGFIKCILGGIYQNSEMFKEGLGLIHSKLNCVLKIMTCIKCLYKLSHKNALSWIKTGDPIAINIFKGLGVMLVNIIKQVSTLAQYETAALQGNKTKEKTLESEISESPFVKGMATVDHYLNDSCEFLEQMMANVKLVEPKQLQEILDNFDPKEAKVRLNTKQWVELISKEIIEPVFKGICNIFDINQIDLSAIISLLIPLVVGDFKAFGYTVLTTLEAKFPVVKDLFDGLSEIISMRKDEFDEIMDKKGKLFEHYNVVINSVSKGLAGIISDILLEKLKFFGKDKPIMNAQLLKAQAFINAHKEALNPIIMILHAIKLNSISKGFMRDIIVNIINTIFDNEKSSPIIANVKKLIIGVLGFNVDKPSEEAPSAEDRIILVIEAVVGIFFSDLSSVLPLIKRLISLVFYFAKGGGAAGKTKDMILKMGEEAALLFGINPKTIHGIMGIINGDIEAIVTFVAPIAKIDPAFWKKIVDVLKGVKEFINIIRSGFARNKKKKIDPSQISDAMKEMTKKIREGTAGVKELFDLVDDEGDKSGGISKDEFGGLLAKLQIDASEHRINEIFTKCKKEGTDNQDELNIDEFKIALEYVQEKDTSIGLNLIGLSNSQLIIILCALVFILVMLLAFILLGMNAFTPGGVFNSIINSMMPMLAGTGVGRGGGPSFNKESLKKKLEGMLDQIKKIMGNKKK